MNFKELKELAKKLGGILVMNGNTPDFVILSYDKYSALEKVNSERLEDTRVSQEFSSSEAELIENLNKEIASLKEEIRQKEETELEETEAVEGDNNATQAFLEEIRGEVVE